MRQTLRRLSALFLALALALSLAPGLAAKSPTIQDVAADLVAAQTAYDTALADYDAIAALVLDLGDQYDNGTEKQQLAVQDALIEALVEEETLAEALAKAESALEKAQQQHEALVKKTKSCETLEIAHDGKYADLDIAVTLDENMVIYDLEVTVDGSERDQAVAEPGYLYHFLGHDLPLTIGNGKKDDVPALEGAAQTAKDLVAALNDLVYAGEEQTGPIIEPQAIADYIFAHGELPENFITKKEAQKRGWDSSYNYVSDVAPGYSIGGDRFGNYEGRLPSKKGRTWYEADCYYTGGRRNAHRILFSNDGLVYYTDDHYETFTQMHPSK